MEHDLKSAPTHRRYGIRSFTLFWHHCDYDGLN